MKKICTSLEQSKKLVELGLDVNTADMCWTNHLFNAFLSSWRIESTSPQEYKNLLDGFAVRGYLIEPAWSLSALLELIPPYLGEFNDGIDFGFGKAMNGKWYSAHYLQYFQNGDVDPVKTVTGDTAVDAAFEMVCWLKENKKI